MKAKFKNFPIRTALLYFITAGIYILFSDKLLEILISDLETLNQIQTYKGLAFVFVTSLLLYFDLRHKIKLLIAEREKSINTNQALRQSELNYRNMANYSPFAKFVNLNRTIVYANQACANLFGFSSPDEMIGKDPVVFFHPDYHEVILERIASLTEIGKSVRRLEEKIIRQDGKVIDVEASSSLFPYENQNAIHVIVRDITELVSARNENERRLFQLQALREIDQAILNSYDLNAIIQLSLSYAKQIAGIDAAVLYLNDSETGMRIYQQSIGFTNEPNLTHGSDRYQFLVQEKESLFIADIRKTTKFTFNSTLIDEDQFISYCGIPLISTGEVKGIVEVFARTPIIFSEECFDLLETMSDQIAIAIDHVRLYEGLNDSLDDLSQAYDATIVGWSRAMDLRDEDTEGHTQRVTHNTLLLAQKMGMSEEELIHVRWGALLHDIGKLGIPDRILLKKGKLTTQEWTIMRQHPNFAFKMLQPISYLRTALDIPYCHHEKWDGSGYPRRLHGEEIPLSARIFAVIDVWDALRSDRPYRPKWPDEKILEYIQSLSGEHFDPKIVATFFDEYDKLDKTID